MAVPQNFRAAFNGFNREDVVNYISFMTSRHETQVNELRSEAEELRTRIGELERDGEKAALLEQEMKALQEALEEKNSLVEVAEAAQEQLDAMWTEKKTEMEAEAERLNRELETRDARIAQLEAELAELRGAVTQTRKTENTSRWTEELNAYRRAESAERRARERVNQMYDRASGALADASVRVEQTAQQVAELAAKVEADLALLMEAISGSEGTLADTAVVLGSIRPELE